MREASTKGILMARLFRWTNHSDPCIRWRGVRHR